MQKSSSLPKLVIEDESPTKYSPTKQEDQMGSSEEN